MELYGSKVCDGLFFLKAKKWAKSIKPLQQDFSFNNFSYLENGRNPLLLETMSVHDDHDALFRFIKTVTQPQFIGLKTWLEALHKDSNRWAFFEYLYKTEEYDEQEILRHFASKFGKFTRRQLTQYKYTTFDWLITSMAKLGYASTSQISLLMESIQILYERGSYLRAARIITKARSILLETEHFEEYKKILLIEIEVVKKIFFNQERFDKLGTIWKEYQRIRNLQHNLDIFTGLRLEYFETAIGKFRQFGIRDFESAESLVSHEFMQDESYAESVRAKILYHRFWGFWHFLQLTHVETLQHFLILYELCTKNPWWIEENREEYYRIVKTITAIYIQKGDRSQSRKYIKVLEKENLENLLIRKMIIDKLINLKFYFYNKFRNRKAGEEAIGLVNDHLEELT